jgi:hypothetical protein
MQFEDQKVAQVFDAYVARHRAELAVMQALPPA